MAAEAAAGLPSQVLVVGARLAPVAGEAIPDAAIEVADAEALAGPLDRFDLVVIDAEALAGEALVAALAHLGPDAAALVAARHLASGVVRALMAHPRAEVIEPPFTSTDLAAAVRRLARSAAPEPAVERRSACWTLTGAVGGCGATTLCVEIAASLVRRRAGRCALIDLNLAGGSAAHYLGVEADMNLADEALDPERIDRALIDAFSVTAACGVDLLAPRRDRRGFAKTRPGTVVRLLEAACLAYDFIIVDLPRRAEAWTADVLAGADESLIVSELTVPALVAARDLAHDIEAEIGRPPRIVLNRLAGRMFGLAPSLAEAEKALGRRAEAAITSDWEAAAACANLGGAIGALRPRSRIVRDVEALVDRLAGRMAERASPVGRASA